MKVLFIHGDRREPGSGGGAESLLRDQADGLRSLGHECAWWYGKGNLQRVLDIYQPDVCHLMTIHCYSMGLYPAIYLQENQIPHIWHIQDYWPFCAGRMMMVNQDQPCSAVRGVCAHECDEAAPPEYLEVVNRSYVVAGNAHTAEIYRRNGMRCDAVVELGVNTNIFAPDELLRERGSIYTSSAWANKPWKGMHLLREAAKGFPVNLITGLPRQKLAAALKRADIFVFPSVYEETFGLCLCEAMAAGCACITTDNTGGIAQIEDGVTGLIVPKHDIKAMREAIDRLLAAPGLRRRLGGAAREHVEKDHTLKALAQRFERVYLEVMNGGYRLNNKYYRRWRRIVVDAILNVIYPNNIRRM